MGSTRVNEPDPLDPDIIQRLDNRFSYRDIPEEYYTDEDGDEVCNREFLFVLEQNYTWLHVSLGQCLPALCRFLNLQRSHILRICRACC